VFKVYLFIRQQAHPQPAIGGYPHPVAIVAVGVTNGAYKADGTFGPGQAIHPSFAIQVAIV